MLLDFVTAGLKKKGSFDNFCLSVRRKESDLKNGVKAATS
jgi:hypothetical protein